MSLLGPDGNPLDGKGEDIKIPQRPPNILDVLRALQGFAVQAAQHEAKITELHVALAILLDKGILTVQELNDKFKQLEEEERARRSKEEGNQVPVSGRGDEADSEA